MHFSLVRTVAPTSYPVTLDEAKAQLRIKDELAEDAVIEQAIVRATKKAEDWQARQYMTATYEQRHDVFPDVILLRRPPVQSVTSIKYTDTGGVLTTLNDSLYDADLHSVPPRIAPAYGESWPATRGEMNAVVITYEAGYGGADDVPDDVKGAILELIAFWFENREAALPLPFHLTPFGFKEALGAERVYWF